jgi:nicotinamidase/pyrazinamidase
VVDEMSDALHAWCEKRTRAIDYVLKGHNMLTEHYSALRADVEREDDVRTQFNQETFNRLRNADRVIICGQALSHCVAFTTRDLLSRWPSEEAAKVVLLKDCASPVPSFEQAAEDFISEITAQGATVTTSDQLEWA